MSLFTCRRIFGSAWPKTSMRSYLFSSRASRQRSMVAILLSAARIAGRGLDVAVRRWANPDVCVGRRNREPPDPQEAGFVANRLSVRVEVFEIVALCLSRVTRLIVADVAQARRLRPLRPGRSRLRSLQFSFFPSGFEEQMSPRKQYVRGANRRPQLTERIND